jgi:hypothetical protein
MARCPTILIQQRYTLVAQPLLGYKPCSPLNFLAESSHETIDVNTHSSSCLNKLELHRDAAQDTIKRSTDRQAYQFNKSPKLKVGDEVLINLHSLELVDVKGHSCKLIQRKIGPFEIIEVMNPTTYKIWLPDSYPMHNVVNIQHLTQYHRNSNPSQLILANPRDSLKSLEEYEVKRIIDKQKRKGKLHYRVRWKGYNAEDDTWQTA